VVDLCFEDSLALTAPWDRFRFDIDIVQPLSRDSGAFLADINGDGLPDLLMASFSGDVLMFPGIAGRPTLFDKGSYLRVATSSVADDPFYFPDNSALWVTGDVGDLDGDGKPEVVIGNVLYQVTGTSPALTLDPQYRFFDVASLLDPAASLADLNGDGKLDVIITAVGRDITGVHLFLNTSSSGSFSFTEQTLRTGPTSFMNAGDIDGDGRVDLVCVDGIYLNSGTKTVPSFDFSTPMPWNITGGPSWTATSHTDGHVYLKDVDGDGLLDAYVSNIGTTVWQVLFYKNTGTAAAHQLVYQGPVVARSSPTNVFYRGDTMLNFSGVRARVASGDFDNNGLTDLSLMIDGNSFTFRPAILLQSSGLSNSGIRTFAYPDLYTFPAHTKITYDCGLFPTEVSPDTFCRPPNMLGAWWDVSGDGLNDAVTLTAQSSGDYLYSVGVRKGSMPFTLAAATALNTKAGPQAHGSGVTLVDIDLDGLTDILTSTPDGALMYYRNAGGPGPLSLEAGVPLTDATGAPITVAGLSWAPAALDLDDDGDLDFLVSDESGQITQVLCVTPGTSSGYLKAGFVATADQNPLTVTHVWGGGNQAPSLTAFDVDGDGVKEVVMGDADGRIWTLRKGGTVSNPLYAIEPFQVSRTSAAFLEVLDTHNVRAYFALPILPGATMLGVHDLPKADGGGVSEQLPISN
jgi:hypothetical protein